MPYSGLNLFRNALQNKTPKVSRFRGIFSIYGVLTNAENWFKIKETIDRRDDIMSKLRLASVVFLIIEAFALIPLTVEIFGNLNTDIITVSAVFFFVGLIGSCICSFIRGVNELKKK